MIRPKKGGAWSRDPETGKLTKVAPAKPSSKGKKAAKTAEAPTGKGADQ